MFSLFYLFVILMTAISLMRLYNGRRNKSAEMRTRTFKTVRIRQCATAQVSPSGLSYYFNNSLFLK